MGLSRRHLIAIGDSRSDFDLFRMSGLSIAINGTPEAINEADVSIDVRDLREVVPVAVASRIDRLLLLTTRLGLPNSARQASSSPNATCALRDARVFAGGGIEPCVGRKWRDVHAGAR